MAEMQNDQQDQQRGTQTQAREAMKSESAPARTAEGVLTRRDWLLKLGEAAVLCGFSGAVEELKAATATPLSLEGALALPPGLYEPSNDHLSHALTSDERFHPIPPGTETDYARPRARPFQPQFFSREEFEIVSRIVELMLGEAGASPQPAADFAKFEEVMAEVTQWIDFSVFSSAGVRQAAQRLAPEHRKLAVAYYGAQAAEELETRDPQKAWREGLQWLEQESEQRYREKFLGLNQDRQIELLKSVSDGQPDAAAENAGTRLFRILKAEVIRGFYTASAGLKELNYKGNAFYAESPGCAATHHEGNLQETTQSGE